jgi:hypothetical protein
MLEVGVDGDGGEGAGHGRRDGEWIEVTRTTAPENHGPVLRSFTEKPQGSNSIEQ